MRKILYSKPSINKLEKKFVKDAIANGWGDKCYDYIYKFQDSYKKYLKVKYALATSSCTGSIHVALKAIGIKPGDEVIVPDATWVASVAPVKYLNATPVFVDVKESSWCIDPNQIEKAITKKQKQLLLSIYMETCDMDSIMKIAKKYKLFVIEDSAEAIGSEYKGKKAGSIGDFGTFSFHGTKTITTGEGGMLVTNNKKLFGIASILLDHGRDPKIKKLFWAERIGFKYKMSNIQAALGYAQMKRINNLVNKKINIFQNYKKKLSKLNFFKLNSEEHKIKNSYWMPTIILDEKLKINREKIINILNKKGIMARPFFYPVSSLQEFKSTKNTPISKKLGKNGINLPSNFDMNNKDTEYVSKIVIKYLKK